MGEGGASEGKNQEDQNHWQSNAQNKPLHLFVKLKPLFECRNGGDNGQNEIDRVVIEELPSDFGTEGVEVELVPADTCTVEAETDEVVLKVPVKNRDAADGGNQQGEIQVGIL